MTTLDIAMIAFKLISALVALWAGLLIIGTPVAVLLFVRHLITSAKRKRP